MCYPHFLSCGRMDIRPIEVIVEVAGDSDFIQGDKNGEVNNGRVCPLEHAERR